MSQKNRRNELDDKYKGVWLAGWAVLALASLVLVHEVLSMVPQTARLIGAGLAVAVCLGILYPIRRFGRGHLTLAFDAGVREGVRREQLRRAAEEASEGDDGPVRG